MQLLHDGVEPARGNDVARERGAAAAVGRAGERVVDRRRRGREIAAPHRRRGHRAEARGDLLVVGALVAAEEERRVADDRPADRAAELVLPRLRLGVAGRQEIRPRLQPLVVVIAEGRAVQLVAAALDAHVRRHAAGQAVVGVEAAGDDADRLDRLERRDVGGHVRQPQVVRDRAFDADGVGVLGGAAGAEDQAAGGVDRDRVHVLRRRHARDHHEQVLVVAADRHRQVRELLRRDLRAHVGAIGLQDLPLGADGDRVGERADDEHRADARHVVLRDGDAGGDRFLEAGQAHRDGEGAGRHGGEGGQPGCRRWCPGASSSSPSAAASRRRRAPRRRNRRARRRRPSRTGPAPCAGAAASASPSTGCRSARPLDCALHGLPSFTSASTPASARPGRDLRIAKTHLLDETRAYAPPRRQSRAIRVRPASRLTSGLSRPLGAERVALLHQERLADLRGLARRVGRVLGAVQLVHHVGVGMRVVHQLEDLPQVDLALAERAIADERARRRCSP